MRLQRMGLTRSFLALFLLLTLPLLSRSTDHTIRGHLDARGDEITHVPWAEINIPFDPFVFVSFEMTL